MNRRRYMEEVGIRWTGPALRDAKGNWRLFRAHQRDLLWIIKIYLRDPGVLDLNSKWHNPECTLTAWLWKCSAARANWWITDFCEHYQRFHLRRGIIEFSRQLIDRIKRPVRQNRNQLDLTYMLDLGGGA
jgi:hypothetical protein